MSARRVQGVFDDEALLVAATERAVRDDFQIVDVFSPYPIHGLDLKMGVKRSRLTWVCFLAGLIGLVLALWFQYWTSAIDWPINIGGKPWNSLPAFVPIAFEITVLFAGLGVVIALFIRTGLLPGKKERMPIEAAVTDDQFVLLLRLEGAQHTVAEARDMLLGEGALNIHDYVEGD